MESTNESPDINLDVFGDELRLHTAMRTKQDILERGNLILENPPEPYQPNPIVSSEDLHYISYDQIRALVKMRLMILDAMKKNPETTIKWTRKGKKYYRYHSEEMDIACADPFDPESLNLGKVTNQKGFNDLNLITIRTEIEDSPVEATMGSVPEVTVTFPPFPPDMDVVFTSSQERDWAKVHEDDAVIVGNVFKKGLEALSPPVQK